MSCELTDKVSVRQCHQDKVNSYPYSHSPWWHCKLPGFLLSFASLPVLHPYFVCFFHPYNWVYLGNYCAPFCFSFSYLCKWNAIFIEWPFRVSWPFFRSFLTCGGLFVELPNQLGWQSTVIHDTAQVFNMYQQIVMLMTQNTSALIFAAGKLQNSRAENFPEYDKTLNHLGTFL